MPDVHVSCALDEELQLCRYMSFVDFVDLLKFSQVRLEDVSRNGSSCATRTVSARQSFTRFSHRAGALDQTESTENFFWRKQAVLDQQHDSFLLQSWTSINEAEPRYWMGCQY